MSTMANFWLGLDDLKYNTPKHMRRARIARLWAMLDELRVPQGSAAREQLADEETR